VAYDSSPTLSSLNKLEDFRRDSNPLLLFFNDETRPPLLARVYLPCIIRLRFSGHRDYLEDFVTRIITPLLCVFEMELDNIRRFGTLQLY
jgi:hypothetical protein